MSCRRASEIDLAAFLADATDADMADFRAHYPSCPECAAEVRAWTQLHSHLQAGSVGPNDSHPAEEMLLKFEQQPASLREPERLLLEDHLAHCRSCQDELRALRSFDFTRLEQPARLPATGGRGLAIEIASALRRLVVHPAFAYALVLVLLLPTVTRYLLPAIERGSDEIREPEQRAAENERVAAGEAFRLRSMPAPPEPAASQLGRESVREPAAPEGAEPLNARERKAADRVERDELPAAKRDADEPRRAAKERLESPPVAASAARGHFAAAPLAESERRAKSLDVLRDTPASGAAGAATGQVQVGGRLEPGWSLLRLERGTTAEIAAVDLDRGVILHVPLPGGAEHATEIELRVVSSDGRREMRERITPAVNDAGVEMRLPAVWLAAGDYRVDLLPGATEPLAQPEPSFRFAIR